MLPSPEICTVFPANSGFSFEDNILRNWVHSPSDPFDSPLPSLTPSPASSRSGSPTPDSVHALTSSPPPDVPSAAHNAAAVACETSSSPGPSPEASEPLSRANKTKKRNKKQSKAHRKKRRLAASEHQASENLARQHAQNTAQIPLSFDAGDISIVTTGYIGQRRDDTPKTFTLHELVGPNSRYKFPVHKWDGKKRLVIVDSKSRVFGVGVGAPRNDSTWDSVHAEAAQALEAARNQLRLDKGDTNHRRGHFPAMRVGISFGGGQKYPKVLRQTPGNKPILDGLLNHWAFKRISGFTSGAFSEVAPRLYSYQHSQLSKLIDEDLRQRTANPHKHQRDEPLRRNFPNTPWAATSFNFGPRTVCFKHADSNNLAFGWCCITALGQFDPTKGGHLVLWDLGIIIEFPPGTSLFIPSAVVSHSNVPIGQHESRYSFTQYSAGRIFSWNDNEFKTVTDFKNGFNDEEWEAIKETLSKQLEFGLSLYTTFPELKRMKPVVGEDVDNIFEE